tara:strand:+ start:1428 stop:1637 length:210 start_codon:yes stop_codon:yes gene_type:complete
MIKVLLSIFVFMGLTVAKEGSNQDSVYSDLDKEQVVLSAFDRDEDNKRSPLRKRSHKRKRRWRHPDIGK